MTFGPAWAQTTQYAYHVAPSTVAVAMQTGLGQRMGRFAAPHRPGQADAASSQCLPRYQVIEINKTAQTSVR